MQNAPWETRVVASMCESKRRGLVFDVAWSRAMKSSPPRSLVEKAIVGDMRGFCRDAWFGERPALRSFSLEMLRPEDGTRNARSAHVWRPELAVVA